MKFFTNQSNSDQNNSQNSKVNSNGNQSEIYAKNAVDNLIVTKEQSEKDQLNNEEDVDGKKDDTADYNIKYDRIQIIEEANKIIKERSKNQGLSLTSRPKGKSAFITDIKDVCLKNYLIGLLKVERTVLSDKESNIQDALINSEKRLLEDSKYFIDYVEREKESLKEKENFIINLTTHNKQLNDRLNELKKERKGLIDDSERTIKNINNLKEISKFVHRLIGKPLEESMNFNSMNSNAEDKKKKAKFGKNKDLLGTDRSIGNNTGSINSKNSMPDKNFESKDMVIEEMANNIILEYGSFTKNNGKSNEILSDYRKLINKFLETEEKIIKIMDKNEDIVKEHTKQKEKYNIELKNLQEQEHIVLREKNKIQNELEKDERSLASLKIQLNESGYNKKENKLLMELYNDVVNFEVQKKRNQTSETSYIKLLMEYLGSKEDKIRELIYSIENYDPKLVEHFCFKRKEINLESYRKILREENEIKNEKRNELARERMNRLVIKGRNIMTHFKPREDKEIKNKTVQKETNKNNMLYF